MKQLRPEEFPALRDFLSGYLHEDFVQEHETPEGAVRAFSREARADEIEQLQDESLRFAAAIEGWPWRDVRRVLRVLGAAWVPRSRSALVAFLAAIAKRRR